MTGNTVTPLCAVCGEPTKGEFYNTSLEHYCNRCGRLMEFARFSPWAQARWRILRPLLVIWRITRRSKS